MLETAKMYALSEHAVMIYGQAGTEDYLLAEAIHNNSIRKVGPYVSINMRGMDKEHQMEELFRREAGDTVSTFGAKGAMIKANHGTLFIKRNRASDFACTASDFAYNVKQGADENRCTAT